ncbi:MAG: AmmeMemoRadiSam system protein B [Planctomycetota bacterium]
MSEQQQNIPPFDESKPHHAKPRIRPTIHGSPVGVRTPQGQQQTMLGLTDRSQIAQRSVVTSPLAQFMLPGMDGDHDIESIASQASERATAAGAPQDALPHINAENVRMLVAQLDHAGLLDGPTYRDLLEKMRADFDSTTILPPGTTAAMADQLAMQELGQDASDEQKAEIGPQRLREHMDKWIDEGLKDAEDPSFDALPRAIIAPHVDYFRGWPNFAHTYGRMRVVDRPDRVIVLGTNHFGFGTGVTGCDKGYSTPLGVCEHDAEFATKLTDALGPENTERLYAHRYDHEREHSIELQIGWIQHVFGADGTMPKVYAALVHDPARNNGESYDNAGLGIQPFIDALRTAIESSPGKTLIVCSANLSHLGRSFGDQQPISDNSEEAQEFRNRVLQHDREMIELIKEGKAEELVASLAWQQNPTRWNSTGALVAAIRALDASEVRMLNYAGVGDQQGLAFITTFAGAIM